MPSRSPSHSLHPPEPVAILSGLRPPRAPVVWCLLTLGGAGLQLLHPRQQGARQLGYWLLHRARRPARPAEPPVPPLRSVPGGARRVGLGPAQVCGTQRAPTPRPLGVLLDRPWALSLGLAGAARNRAEWLGAGEFVDRQRVPDQARRPGPETRLGVVLDGVEGHGPRHQQGLGAQGDAEVQHQKGGGKRPPRGCASARLCRAARAVRWGAVRAVAQAAAAVRARSFHRWKLCQHGRQIPFNKTELCGGKQSPGGAES